MYGYDNEWAAELDDDLFFIDRNKLPPQEEPKGGAESDTAKD